METGDLLLFHGEGWISSLLEYFGCSVYSHVGILIKNPSFLHPGLEDGWYVLDASWGYVPDSEDNQFKYGVQLHKLDDIMKLYSSHSVYVRKIKAVRDESFYEKLKQAHEVVHNKPYNLNIMDWISAKENMVEPFPVSSLWKNTQRFWCSALVSYVYMKLGWISDLNWSLVAPREFSSKECTGKVVFTCIISEEEHIELLLTY